jgi:phosphopentomutase
MRIDRVFLIVMDGVGVGELPDAAVFGDVGSNSLGQTARVLGGLRLPQLEAMGLGNLTAIEGVPPRPETVGAYGKMAERSLGKCSTVGHWEIAGVAHRYPCRSTPTASRPRFCRPSSGPSAAGPWATGPPRVR